MDEKRQDDQLEPIYNSSVPIQDVALNGQWTIKIVGERGSGKSMLAVRHDDDENVQLFLEKYLSPYLLLVYLLLNNKT